MAIAHPLSSSCDGHLAAACFTPPWELDAAEAFAAVVDLWIQLDDIYNGPKGEGQHWSPAGGRILGAAVLEREHCSEMLYSEWICLKGKEAVVLVIHLLLCYFINSPGFNIAMAAFAARQCQESFHVCVCQ